MIPHFLETLGLAHGKDSGQRMPGVVKRKVTLRVVRGNAL